MEEVGKVIADGGAGAFITGSTFLADGGATASTERINLWRI